MFYQAVVVVVLLCGLESWCLPTSESNSLEGFHEEAARRFTGMRPKKRGETGVYPRSTAVLQKARFLTVRVCIAKRRQTAAALVAGRPVLEVCMKMERMRGAVPHTMWWDQDIDLEMAHEAAASSAEKTEGGPGLTLELGFLPEARPRPVRFVLGKALRTATDNEDSNSGGP